MSVKTKILQDQPANLHSHLHAHCCLTLQAHFTHVHLPLQTCLVYDVTETFRNARCLIAFLPHNMHQQFLKCTLLCCIAYVNKSKKWVCCSNYLSLHPGSRELHGGIAAHVYNRGWQIFPIFTNAFFLVSPTSPSVVHGCVAPAATAASVSI